AEEVDRPGIRRWAPVARGVLVGAPHTQRTRDELRWHIARYQVALLPARQYPRQIRFRWLLVRPGFGDRVGWFQEFGVDRGHEQRVVEPDGHLVGDRRADGAAAEQIGTGGVFRPDRCYVSVGHRRHR